LNPLKTSFQMPPAVYVSINCHKL